MNKINIFAVLGILLIGCGSGVSNEPIAVPKQECPVCEECKECPVVPQCPAEGETIFAGFDEFTDRLQLDNIKLNHFVNGEMVEENFADVYTIDGKIATQNTVTLPDFNGEIIKHVLVVEFYQNK